MISKCMELGATEEASPLPYLSHENIATVDGEAVLKVVLEQVQLVVVKKEEQPVPVPLQSPVGTPDPVGSELKKCKRSLSTISSRNPNEQQQQRQQSSFGSRKNIHIGLNAEYQKKLDTVDSAMGIYQKIQYLKKRITRFETQFYDPEGRRLAVLIKRCSDNSEELDYKIIASTQPIPRENSFIVQKYEQCLKLLAVNFVQFINGLPDDGLSCSDDDGEPEDTNGTSASSSSSSFSPAGNGSDSDFIPGRGRLR